MSTAITQHPDPRVVRGEGKEELDRLVDMLNDYEIKIAIYYLSNLLLSQVDPSGRSHSHSS